MATSRSLDTKTIYEQLLGAKRTTAYALEKAANLGNKTITAAMRRNTGISQETAQKIKAVYPDVSVDWLRFGEGEMLTATPKNDGGKLSDTKPVDFVRQMPFEDFMEAHVLIREARAGYLAARGDTVYLDKLPTMLVPREFEKGDYLVIEAVGDSMDDGTTRAILDGDKLLAVEVEGNNWKKTLAIDRYLYIISSRTEAPVVKQIIDIDAKKGMIMCHSWNQRFDDYPVFFDDIHKVFLVKKIVERQVKIPVPWNVPHQ